MGLSLHGDSATMPGRTLQDHPSPPHRSTFPSTHDKGQARRNSLADRPSSGKEDKGLLYAAYKGSIWIFSSDAQTKAFARQVLGCRVGPVMAFQLERDGQRQLSHP